MERGAESPENTRLQYFWLLCGLGLILILGITHLSIGARHVSLQLLMETLTQRNPGSFDQQILFRLRLPRLFAAILCGASLGIGGRLLQSVLRNPLAEPHILGLNAGASLAIVAISVTPISWMAGFPLSRAVIAATGSGMLFTIILLLSSAGRIGLTMTKVTFCGIALSALASALVSAILILDQETLEEIRYWLAGDLSGIGFSDVISVLPLIVIASLSTLWIIPRLDVLALGDSAATSLGVPIRQTRLAGLVATALFCGSAVSLSGPIGFVGLIAGGLAHRLAGSRHAISIPLTALMGACLMIVADIAARTIAPPHEIATGIMTAFIGAPVFIALVSRVLK